MLVFGAIQRFFPDFFPSCFTESRQNLLNLYESTEYTEVTIDETWNEKLARVGGAIGFLLTNSAKNLVSSISGDDANDIGEDKVNGAMHGKASEDGKEANGVNGATAGKVKGTR